VSTIESPPTDVTTGLTASQVAERVAAGQTNDVPARASRTVGEIVRANVFTRFNAIVGVLFAIILVIGPIQDGLFGFVIIINTGIGIFQELRAKRTLERLAIVGEARPRVRRDGTTAELAPSGVVLDDVIELGPGDKIVVDGIVLAADGLEVDESLLTGESDLVHKQPGDQVLSGSFVAAGGGAQQATKVGREAYAAKLAEEASKFTLVNSELRSGIDKILKIITYLLVPAAALIIWSQFRTVGNDLPEALRGMVAALVPMVPEGLVLLTSIAFAVGVIRLGKRNCLVQELPAIEGLARVDTVCADKTGTLTENGMRLARVTALGTHDETRAREALGALGVSDKRPNASLIAIAEACPSPTWTVSATQPFSSARKWSGASFADRGNWVLGAPDVLLPEGSADAAEAERIGSEGLRVLLLGSSTGQVDDPVGPGDIDPVALVVLEQKVRPEAAGTLAYFAEQDVDVKVISGDNALSVGAVASSLGLTGAHAPIDARELPETDKELLADEVTGGTVFGRVTPAQKRAMVGALQSRGRTVAMTGDGVNDVLALKDADIGVAMGSGSPATRAVAQIVLLDDSFATLPHVVAEGRRVIGNIERVANLFLTKTVYSVLLAIAIGAIGVPFPFLPRHLTLIGSLTIGIPAFFLALAPNTERARTGFVKRVLRLAAPSGIIAGVGTVVTYLIVRTDPGATEIQQKTAAVLTLYLIATGVLAVVARPFAMWKVALILASLAAFAYALLAPLPFGRDFWQLDAGDTQTMLVGLTVAVVGIVLVEIANLVITRRLARTTTQH